MKPRSFDGTEVRRPPKQTLRRIYAMPLCLGGVSFVGMLSGLFGDGAWDWTSWLTLGLLLVLIAVCVFRK